MVWWLPGVRRRRPRKLAAVKTTGATRRAQVERQAKAWGVSDRTPVLERIAPLKPKPSRRSLSSKASAKGPRRSPGQDSDQARRRKIGASAPSDRSGGDFHKAMRLSQKALAARGPGVSPGGRDKADRSKSKPRARPGQPERMREDQDCRPRPDPNRRPGGGSRAARSGAPSDDDDKRKRRKFVPWCRD